MPRRVPAAGKARARLSFARRAFLVSLIGICAAISVSFLAVNLAIRTEIKAGIKDSLQRTERAIELARTAQSSRMALALQLISEDPSLQQAVRELEPAGGVHGARAQAEQVLDAHARTVREFTGSDFVTLSDSRGNLLAEADGQEPSHRMPVARYDILGSGLHSIAGTLYDVTCVPIRMEGRLAGALTLGKRFDFAGLDQLGPAGLLYRGRLVRSTFSPAMAAEAENRIDPDRLRGPDCARAGCELRLGAEDFLVTPVSRAFAGTHLGDEYQILSFRSIDAAIDEITRRFRMLLPVIGLCIVLLAVCISALASRAVSHPLQQLVARLARSEASGILQPDFPEDFPTREINQLAASFNQAAAAAMQCTVQLDLTSIEFVETMAHALDARDPYTAGHSNRVRDYATAIATAMQLPAEEIEVIRVGAQLHDIGKIGIPDAVLQKPGYLTPEEYELVKLHPQIGKRILERVAQFKKYLPIVELHHEDQEGRGYPYGLKGHEVPLAVRIVHVADVFDAITTDRSYRQAMSTRRAHEILELSSGTQFDPEVVRVFSGILAERSVIESSDMERLASIVSG
jgi:HD-GYP domain-containing protein (c-di-GMP phosphodiesterase class II)